MTENEAIERIKKDACNNSCMIPQLCNDGCMYGHTKCAFSMAIKALEEVQQYRQIGKISTCRNAVEICKSMIERGIDLDNIAEYIKFEDNLVRRGYDLKKLLEMMDEHKQYCQLGTVEECRKAVDARKRVQEIADGQLIAGKNNYGEVYDCFRKIVKVGTRKLLDWCEKQKEKR